MGEKLTKVLAAGKAGGRHSSLYVWMRDNHAALSAEFAKNGPQWAIRVPAMVEIGLVDAAGQPPSIRTAMQTWYRVCRAMGTPSPRRQASPQPPAPVRPQPPPEAPQAGTRTIQLRSADGKTTLNIPKK